MVPVAEKHGGRAFLLPDCRLLLIWPNRLPKVVPPVLALVLGFGCFAGAWLWLRIGRSLNEIPGSSARSARFIDWQVGRLAPTALASIGLVCVIVGAVRLFA